MFVYPPEPPKTSSVSQSAEVQSSRRGSEQGEASWTRCANAETQSAAAPTHSTPLHSTHPPPQPVSTERKQPGRRTQPGCNFHSSQRRTDRRSRCRRPFFFFPRGGAGARRHVGRSYGKYVNNWQAELAERQELAGDLAAGKSIRVPGDWKNSIIILLYMQK